MADHSVRGNALGVGGARTSLGLRSVLSEGLVLGLWLPGGCESSSLSLRRHWLYDSSMATHVRFVVHLHSQTCAMLVSKRRIHLCVWKDR